MSESKIEITSINLLAWLRANGVAFTYKLNESGYCAGVVEADDEYKMLAKEYREFKELQSMIHEFKEIKAEMIEFKRDIEADEM